MTEIGLVLGSEKIAPTKMQVMNTHPHVGNGFARKEGDAVTASYPMRSFVMRTILDQPRRALAGQRLSGA